MKAVIVAGGRGERLKPITDNIPKPMVVVGGRTILEHTINLLKDNGITDFILALCYLPQVIVNHFGDGRKLGIKIKYTFEDPNNPLGTAGAIRESEKYIDRDFIVTYADILRELDVKKMIQNHLKSDVLATINVYKEYEEVPRSCVKIGENSRLLKFIENPDIKNKNGSFVWCNGSYYIFKKDIFKYLGKIGKKDFGKDIFPKLIEEKIKVNAYKSYGYILDIGTIEKLNLAEKLFKDGNNQR